MVDDPLVIEPLSRARLPVVIQQPARRAGLQFVPGLVEQMVEETTGGDALPLLAYLLRELFQQAEGSGHVTVAEYEALGGVIGALQRRADRLTDELGRRGRGESVLPTLTKFAAIAGDAEPTSRRIPRTALAPDQQAVVDAFVDARLLTSSADPDRETFVGVAHEALLRQWQPLREAIEDARVSIRMRSELERLAADWDLGGRDDSYLLGGARLSAFAEWAAEHSSEVRPLERQFIDGAKTLAYKQLEAARRSNRRLRTLALGLAVVLVMAVASGGLAGWQWQRASTNQRRASSNERAAIARGMVAESDRVLRNDPRTALRLGVAANQIDPGPLTQAGLLQALTSTAYRGTLGGRASGAPPQQFVDPLGVLAPDAKMVVTARKDNTIVLWDLSDRTHPLPLKPLAADVGRITSAAFAPDGKTLATVSEDAVIFWDLSDRGRPRELSRHSTSVDEGLATDLVAYAPDGRTFVTSDGGALTLWDLADRARPRRLKRSISDDGKGVSSIAFIPNSSVLAVGSGGTVKFWNLRDRANPQRLGQLPPDKEAKELLAFTSDGQTLATISDKAVLLWDLGDPGHARRLGQPLTHDNVVYGMAFSPDGRTLATAGLGKTITLWNVTKREHALPIREPLTGHTDTVTSLAFAPDSHTLVSASNDETVMMWDIGDRDYPQQLSERLRGHVGYVSSLALAPDGKTLASGSKDRSVILWDVDDRNHPRRLGRALTGHMSEVDSIAFAPDSKTMATAGGDQTIILWDTNDREHPRRFGQPLAGHEDNPRGVPDPGLASVAFAPDGRTLAATSGAQVILWDIEDLNRPRLIGSTLDGIGPVAVVAFAPSGHLLATAGWDKNVVLWDVSNAGHPRRLGEPLTEFADEVTSLAFAPDGGLLAAGSYNAISLFDLTDPTHANRLGQILKGRGEVTPVAFTLDGHILATGGWGGFDLWDLTDRNHPRLLGQPPLSPDDDISNLALDRSGNIVATAGATDRDVTLWNLAPLEELRNNMVAEGCIRAGGPLDKATWDSYAPGLRYWNTCLG